MSGDWRLIISAAEDRPNAIERIVSHARIDNLAGLATLLLLEKSPPGEAALVVVAKTLQLSEAPGPMQAALAPQLAPALATWRADPQWAVRMVGAAAQEGLASGVSYAPVALRSHPAALRDAVAIVLRDCAAHDVARCLDALGADGWAMLEDAQRTAVASTIDASFLGWSWTRLDAPQRAAAARQAASSTNDAANVVAWLIRRIGAAAWRTTEPTLRRELINVVASAPWRVAVTAPAWTGMTDDERARLIAAVVAHGTPWDALLLLDALGAVGRATLTAEQRAALDGRAMEGPGAWRVLAWRAADVGWDALSAKERRAVLAMGQDDRRTPDVLRTVGAAGWSALRPDEQAHLALVRYRPHVLFECPPALWADLAGKDLPPAPYVPWNALKTWRAEDVDDDLGRLPAAHQALVLALAPWRREDAAPDSVRLQRLRAAWRALQADDRVALVRAHPSVLPTVAAAARLRGGAAAATTAVGETVVRLAAGNGAADDAKRTAVADLCTTGRWRDWMVAFAPTDGDASDVWKAWCDAARRGLVADSDVCVRLAASGPRESESRRALRGA